MPIARAPFMGFDILLDDRIGLQLVRDGRQPASTGGAFGQAVATGVAGDKDQYVVYDRLHGGMGGTDRLIPHSYAFGIDVTTRFGRVWTPGGEITRLGTLPNGVPPGGTGTRTPGRIRAMAVFGDSLLVGAGGVLLKLVYPYDLASATVETTLDNAEEIASILIYQGLICLGTQRVTDGTPGSLYVKHPSGTWLRSANDLDPAKRAYRQYLAQAYFRVDSGSGVVGEWRLDGNDSPASHTWIATTDPILLCDHSAWITSSGQGYPVADSTHPITAIVASHLVIYHIKTDGLYQMQPDGRAARIMDWSSSLHPNNGKHAVFAHGSVYASHGRRGLVKIDVANQQIQWSDQACAPGSGMPRVTPISGQLSALGLDGEWLVGVVYNGTDSFVCYGRPIEIAQQAAMENILAPQPLVWHGSEATFWSQEVTCVLQASIGGGPFPNRPLLWVASMQGGVPQLANVSLPATGSPLEDWVNHGPHRFTTDCWLYFPREDLGANESAGWANAQKIFTRVETSCEYLERYATYVEVYMSTAMGYEIFQDRVLDPEHTPWQFLGRLEDSIRASMVPPSTVQSGPQATLMLRGHSEADHPFVFNSAKLRAMPLSEQAERRRFKVILAGHVRKRNQTLDRRDQYSLLNEMQGFQGADPISLLTRYNVRFMGKVEEGLSWQESIDPMTKEPVVQVDFTYKVLKRPFYWGQGQRWGQAITWSGPVEPIVSPI